MELATTGGPDFFKGHGSPAEVRLFVDGEQVGASASLPHTVPNLFGDRRASAAGTRPTTRVDPDAYLAPFAFTGDDPRGGARHHRRAHCVHPEAEMTRLMVEQ
ncbi:MAG: hypothetical protein V9E93_16700 [Steroidobacteraceae bacterium]